MKTSKECVTCIYHSKFPEEKPCYGCYGPEWVNWKPIETKKMKSTYKRIIEVLKEMFIFSVRDELNFYRIASVIMFTSFSYDALKSIGEKSSGKIFTFMDILFVFVILVGFWLLGYFSRKPDPNRKGFKKWLKICILKVQIWHKQAYLFWYHDLKKYRGNPKRKEKVCDKRNRLKELKRELKELI